MISRHVADMFGSIRDKASNLMNDVVHDTVKVITFLILMAFDMLSAFLVAVFVFLIVVLLVWSSYWAFVWTWRIFGFVARGGLFTVVFGTIKNTTHCFF
jgi:hypothetical protein